VGSTEHESLDDPVTLGHEIFGHNVEIREALAVREPHPVRPLLTRLLPPHRGIGLLVVHTISGEKLIEHAYLAVQPELTQDAADDRFVFVQGQCTYLLLGDSVSILNRLAMTNAYGGSVVVGSFVASQRPIGCNSNLSTWMVRFPSLSKR